MGIADLHGRARLGRPAGALEEPEAPGFKDMLGMGQLLRTLWHMAPHRGRRLPGVVVGPDVDLARLPMQHCWPRRRGPAHHLGPHHHARAAQGRQNLGIYRQQVLSRKNQLIMRWLAHRGGALDFADHCAQHPWPALPRGRGVGPTRHLLGAVTPVPDGCQEYQFAGPAAREPAPK